MHTLGSQLLHPWGIYNKNLALSHDCVQSAVERTVIIYILKQDMSRKSKYSRRNRIYCYGYELVVCMHTVCSSLFRPAH